MCFLDFYALLFFMYNNQNNNPPFSFLPTFQNPTVQSKYKCNWKAQCISTSLQKRTSKKHFKRTHQFSSFDRQNTQHVISVFC